MPLTVGQIIVNDCLPPEFRDYTRVLDSKGLEALLQRVAHEKPELYSEITKKLMDVGNDAAFDEGVTLRLSAQSHHFGMAGFTEYHHLPLRAPAAHIFISMLYSLLQRQHYRASRIYQLHAKPLSLPIGRRWLAMCPYQHTRSLLCGHSLYPVMLYHLQPSLSQSRHLGGIVNNVPKAVQTPRSLQLGFRGPDSTYHSETKSCIIVYYQLHNPFFYSVLLLAHQLKHWFSKYDASSTSSYSAGVKSLKK
jgi:hypothetical protein